jgi:hypothetical protein
MNRTIERLKLIFLGIFAVANVGMLVWQFGWVVPEQKCVEAKKWWDGSQRVCAQPILTSDITGRVITDAKVRAEAMRAIGRIPPAETAAPKP